MLVPGNLSPCWMEGYGVGVTVKFAGLVAVPQAVETDIVPVTAPGMTIPTITVPVLETTIAGTPPMVKEAGLLKHVPVMLTSVPTGPDAGLNEEIAGPGGA